MEIKLSLSDLVDHGLLDIMEDTIFTVACSRVREETGACRFYDYTIEYDDDEDMVSVMVKEC